jgi:alkylhydroperoxidase family enzyme
VIEPGTRSRCTAGQEVSVTAEIHFDDIVGARADYAAALCDVEDALWAQDLVSPVILELCRLRIAQILGCAAASEYRSKEAVAGGLDETLVASLTRWTTDPGFDSRARACLEYAEELLIDAKGVRDEQARAAIAQIGEGGFLVLTYACGLFETTQRARLVLGTARW